MAWVKWIQLCVCFLRNSSLTAHFFFQQSNGVAMVSTTTASDITQSYMNITLDLCALKHEDFIIPDGGKTLYRKFSITHRFTLKTFFQFCAAWKRKIMWCIRQARNWIFIISFNIWFDHYHDGYWLSLKEKKDLISRRIIELKLLSLMVGEDRLIHILSQSKYLNV